MKLTFTAPVDQAHLEINYSFPVTENSTVIPSLLLSGPSPALVLAVVLGGTQEINGALTYSGKVILTSTAPTALLNTLISSEVEVDLPDIPVSFPLSVKATSQTSKRSLTTLSATVVQS